MSAITRTPNEGANAATSSPAPQPASPVCEHDPLADPVGQEAPGQEREDGARIGGRDREADVRQIEGVFLLQGGARTGMPRKTAE